MISRDVSIKRLVDPDNPGTSTDERISRDPSSDYEYIIEIRIAGTRVRTCMRGKSFIGIFTRKTDANVLNRAYLLPLRARARAGAQTARGIYA